MYEKDNKISWIILPRDAGHCSIHSYNNNLYYPRAKDLMLISPVVALSNKGVISCLRCTYIFSERSLETMDTAISYAYLRSFSVTRKCFVGLYGEWAADTSLIIDATSGAGYLPRAQPCPVLTSAYSVREPPAVC